jgi:hypothetical protein
MQHGCMERLNRKRGPEVWQFRWSVTGLTASVSTTTGSPVVRPQIGSKRQMEFSYNS